MLKTSMSNRLISDDNACRVPDQGCTGVQSTSLNENLTYFLVLSPGEGSGNPLQYACLENPMDRGAWRATVHGVAKHQTQLSD